MADDMSDYDRMLSGCVPQCPDPAAHAEVERLRRVEKHAREVMKALENYGEGIVGHLLDDDDNSGEYLRRALNDAEAGRV